MPTGLFPRGAPRPTTSKAEQTLHAALARGLSEGWTAWHAPVPAKDAARYDNVAGLAVELLEFAPRRDRVFAEL